MSATLRCAAGAILTLCLAMPAAAADAAVQPSFSAHDLFGLEYAGDPEVSPDGRQVAYERRFLDIKTDRVRSGIWLVAADGSGQQPMATGSYTEMRPRWSPDGRRLAYVAADEDGSHQIFVRYLDTGATARVTNVFDAPTEMAWSPDGRSIAFIMNVPEQHKPLDVKLMQPPKGAKWAEPLKLIDRTVYRADGRGYLPDAHAQLFVVAADGGAPRQLTDEPYDHRGIAWFADGSEIVVSANRRKDRDQNPMDSELYAVKVTDGSMRALTDRYGPDVSPVISPDGRQIAWTGFDDRLLGYQRAHLYVMDLDGSHRRELAPDVDRGLQNPEWMPDGRSLIVKSEDHGRTRVLKVSLDGKVRVLADDLGGDDWSRPYPQGSFSVSAAGVVAYTATDPQRPAQVAVVDRKGRSRWLTDLSGDLLRHRRLAQVEEINFKSSADGRSIQGWIVKPPGFQADRKYPLILEIHGGPFLNYGPRFAVEMQLYAAAGYVVLYTNPRGSTGYGEAFGNLIHHAYPGQDYDDLMSGVDAVIARGYVDPDRLYVTGGSGGGVLTAWIVGSNDRFKAAVVQKPVINWTSFALTADMTTFFAKYWFGAMPWEQHEAYWRRSPLSRVGNVKTPTMVVTGEHDMRTPSSEAEQFYEALKLRGVEAMMIRVPGAPHALDLRPSQLAARNQYIVAWFNEHGGSAPATGE